MQTYIAENIKNLRNSKNVTQEELAAYLNISFQSVSKWERGENIPDIQTLAALSNYFDVTTDELLGMEKIRGDFFTNEFHIKEHELMKEKSTMNSSSFYNQHARYIPTISVHNGHWRLHLRCADNRVTARKQSKCAATY